ncbi:MAG: hypothetical protein ABL915_04635, partial [Gallionella sp.]
MSLAHSYTLADITRWFSRNEINRAKAYLNSITDLDIQADIIRAKVQGTQRLPYELEILLQRDKT